MNTQELLLVFEVGIIGLLHILILSGLVLKWTLDDGTMKRYSTLLWSASALWTICRLLIYLRPIDYDLLIISSGVLMVLLMMLSMLYSLKTLKKFVILGNRFTASGLKTLQIVDVNLFLITIIPYVIIIVGWFNEQTAHDWRFGVNEINLVD